MKMMLKSISIFFEKNVLIKDLMMEIISREGIDKILNVLNNSPSHLSELAKLRQENEEAEQFPFGRAYSSGGL